MGPFLLLSPLTGLVKSVGGGLVSLATGAIKGITGALGGSAASEEEQNQQSSQSHGSGTPSRNSGTDGDTTDAPTMFGDLDLTKVKSTLEDAGPMGPEEEGPKTVYKIMIGVLQGMAQTLLRMESTMKMLLAIEYERIKGIVSQSASENIIQAQTDGDPPEKGRGFFGRAKDVITGGYRKAKDSSAWMKILGLSGLLFAMKHWEEDLKEGFTTMIKWIDEQYDWLTDPTTSGKEKWNKFTAGVTDLFLEMINSMTTAVMDALSSWVFGTTGDRATSKSIDQFFESGEELKTHEATAKEAGITDLGTMSYKEGGISGDVENIETHDAKNQKMDSRARRELTDSARKRWKSMYDISKKSDFVIQWTDVPYMSDGITGVEVFGITGAAHTLTYADMLELQKIMTSQPIIGGHISTYDDLKRVQKQGLGSFLGYSEKTHSVAEIEGIKENAAEMSDIRWENQNWSEGAGVFGMDLYRTSKFRPNVFKGYNNDDKAMDDIMKLQLDSENEWKALSAEELKKLNASNAELLDLAKDGKSLSTHDHHLEELLKPVSKAFADGKQAPAVVMAPDNRNQSVTKLGDTYSGGLGSRVQESTAQMLAYTKNLNSTTGQFA